jgi:ABC-type bacteriocin/lantibiotic exporters, contain an N-terminal double-glycine peptidase domain
VLDIGSSIVPSVIIQNYFDYILPLKNYNAILIAFIVVAGSYMTTSIIEVLFDYLNTKFVSEIINEIKQSIFKIILSTDYLKFRKIQSNILNVFVKDLSSLQDGEFSKIISITISILQAIIASVYLIFVNIYFFVGVVLIIVLSFLPLYYINKTQKNFIKKAQKAEQDQTKYVSEFINKPLFIKTNYKIDFIINGFRTIADRLMKNSLRRELNFRFYLIVKSILYAILPAFIYAYGGYLFFNNLITLGKILAAALIVSNIYNPIFNISSFILTIKDIIPRINRIIWFTSLESEHNNEGNVSIPTCDHIKITFEGVTCKLDNNTIIDDVTLTFEQGKTYLINGISGSGKTTIFNLLTAVIEPTRGSIKINGVSYQKIPKQEIRHIFSLVTQDAFFFKGTILDNLKIVNCNVSIIEIKKALYLSCCDEFISDLPKGLNTLLEENANNLSGGQRQRLNIARSLLRKHTFLLFDEATSALNPEIEKKVLDRIHKNKCNVIHISHTNSSIQYCDIEIDIVNKKMFESYIKHSDM